MPIRKPPLGHLTTGQESNQWVSEVLMTASEGSPTRMTTSWLLTSPSPKSWSQACQLRLLLLFFFCPIVPTPAITQWTRCLQAPDFFFFAVHCLTLPGLDFILSFPLIPRKNLSGLLGLYSPDKTPACWNLTTGRAYISITAHCQRKIGSCVDCRCFTIMTVNLK